MMNIFTNSEPTNRLIDWFISLISVILSMFYDARVVLHAVLFLICIDQVMGVTFALKNKLFSWGKFNKVFTKVILYIAAILAAFVYERYLLNSQEIYFTKIMAALVGAKEVSSSYIKFASMTGIKVFESIFEKIKG